MSLRGFHLLFIVLSSLLAFALGGYCLRRYAEQGGAGAVAGAVGSFAAAIGLLLYGRWFVRKMRRILAIAVVCWLWGALPAAACQVCYGQATGPMIDGAKLGVFLLLAVTVAVQGGFLAFFLYLRKQAQRASRDALNAEWVDLQKGPVS